MVLRNLWLTVRIWFSIILPGIVIFSLILGSKLAMLKAIFWVAGISVVYSLPSLLLMTTVLILVDSMKVASHIKARVVVASTLLACYIAFVLFLPGLGFVRHDIRFDLWSYTSAWLFLPYFFLGLISAIFWVRKDLNLRFNNTHDV